MSVIIAAPAPGRGRDTIRRGLRTCRSTCRVVEADWGYTQPDWMPWSVCRITYAWLDWLQTAETPSNEMVWPLV